MFPFWDPALTAEPIAALLLARRPSLSSSRRQPLESAKARDWRLVGHSYRWMFPIYGLLAPLGQPMHNLLRPHIWLLRSLAHLIGIWVIEFVSGWPFRKLTGKCPWGYSNFPGNFRGIVTLEYAPVWFLFGLAFERVHDALVKLTPTIQKVLT